MYCRKYSFQYEEICYIRKCWECRVNAEFSGNAEIASHCRTKSWIETSDPVVDHVGQGLKVGR